MNRFVSAILLAGVTARVSLAASASKSDKPPIPADLFYTFKSISEAENAIIDWQHAGEIEIPLPENAIEIIRYCWTPGTQEPSADDLAQLKHWLQQNQEALKLFDASLQKTKAQWPERGPQDLLPEIRAVSQLIRARLFEANQLAEQKKFDVAAQSLEGSLKLTEIGIEGDGATQIQYLISAGARLRVQEAILRFASRHQVPLPLLQRLLRDLPSIDSETNTYARILRVSFSLSDYGKYDLDLKRMADNWVKVSETNAAMELFPEEMRRAFKVLIDPSLILKHPKPLDSAAMIENDIRDSRILRTNSYSAWTNRSEAIEKERDAKHEKFLKDIQPLLDSVKDEPLPLSHQAAQRALGAYIKIENPIGRIYSFTSLADSDVRLFRYRTEREATRTVLALLIFERQKGVLPARLSDLVDAKILDSVPNDPFSGASILYSRDRRLVWSVGEDGVDDNGTGDDKFRWAGDDAVWQIPELH